MMAVGKDRLFMTFRRMARDGVAVCAVAMISLTSAQAGPINGTQVMVSGNTYFAQNANRTWSLNLTDEPPCMYRFELRPGDRWVNETPGSVVERSELRGPVDETNPSRFDAETWTAYQFRIEPGAPSTASWVVIGDWHVRPDPEDTGIMSSPWQLELRRGDILVFDIRASSQKPVLSNAPEQHVYTSSAPIARGVWHSLVSVADFDWQPKGTGGVTVWLDGEEIVDHHGPFGYNTARPPYFKFGIYRVATRETLAVDYANIEISRTSLASRIHSPPRVCGRQE
jgi:hypothetical protein